RRRVLDAAANLFAVRGYHGTSIEDIAEKAGLTRGAIYSNFASKEDLLVAVMYEVSGVFDDPVFGDASLSFPVRLRRFAAHLVARWSSVREAVLLYSELELLAARDPRLRRRTVAAWQPTLQAQADALEAVGAHPLPLQGLPMMLLFGAATRGLLR